MSEQWEYGFIADGSGPYWYAYGGLVGFTSAEMARHTGEKCYWKTLTIVRRRPESEDWEEVPDVEAG